MGNSSGEKSNMRILLMDGNIVLGSLAVLDVDMFWCECTFQATPAFQSVRRLFDEHARLRRAATTPDKEVQAAERDAREHIAALGLHLQIDGAVIRRFLIYIDGMDAGIRW
ncbi:MAG: hypothetical protein ACR2JW_02685 [Thermomicrobiales bacterium]